MERVRLFGLFGHKKKNSVNEGLLQNDVSATLKCLRYTQLHHRSRWGQTDIDPALQTFSLVPMIPVCKNKWEHWLRRLFVGKRPPKHCSRSISWGGGGTGTAAALLLLFCVSEFSCISGTAKSSHQHWSPVPRAALDRAIMYKKGENMKERRMNRKHKESDRERGGDRWTHQRIHRESKQRAAGGRASAGRPSPPHSPFPPNKRGDISTRAHKTHICAHTHTRAAAEEAEASGADWRVSPV